MNELENRFTVEFWESDFDLHEEKVVIPEAASSGLFSRRHTGYRHMAGCLPLPHVITPPCRIWPITTRNKQRPHGRFDL